MPSPPQIVTTDLDGPQQQDVNNSPHTPVNQQQPGSDPSHLSPSNQGALAPGSPTLTTSSSVHFNEDGSPTSQIPPSYHSDIAGATTANNSLSVPDSPSKHKRKWSIGTWSSNGKERDVFVVETEDNDSDEDSDKKKKKKGKEELVSHLDPSKDTTDPSPFKEKPSTLAMLVDPKSLDDLEKIGGVQGLLNGLGVDPSRGLPAENSSNSGAPRSSSEQRAIDGGDGAQWSATYEQRRKVYGRNDLPERKSKSIFQLMWEAFKDKVLVRTLSPAPLCFGAPLLTQPRSFFPSRPSSRSPLVSTRISVPNLTSRGRTSALTDVRTPRSTGSRASPSWSPSSSLF